MRAVRRHHNRKQFTEPARRQEDRRASSGGASTCSCRLDGDDVLVIHLGMSGQLLRAKTAREAMAKHTHVVITFTQGGQLRFVDPRTFGEMFVTEIDDIEKQVDELAHLGIDPLETAMSWELLRQLLAAAAREAEAAADGPEVHRRHRQHLQRRDPLGRRAALGPHERRCRPQEVRRLYRAMMETLQEAVKHRGSSLADEQYVDLFGEARASTSAPQRVRPRRRVLPALPARHRARRSAGGRCTFFCSEAARCDRGAAAASIRSEPP